LNEGLKALVELELGDVYVVLEEGEFEGVREVLLDVLLEEEFFQERRQVEHLLVLIVVAHKRRNGNAIGEVEAKGENRIVYDDQVLEVPVHDNVEVLHEEAVDKNAVISVESFLEELLLRIDVLKNLLGVVLHGCSEQTELKLLGQPLQHVPDKGPLLHHHFLPVQLELVVWRPGRLPVRLEFGSYQRFVHIEYHRLLLVFHPYFQRLQHEVVFVIFVVPGLVPFLNFAAVPQQTHQLPVY